MDVRAVPNAPKGVIMMTADGPDIYTIDRVGTSTQPMVARSCRREPLAL
ncbi:MAG: hypothetical protein SFU84_12580 [Gemmatimonadales bacterium]|nr:hypothetical protein [Gemmatimonadales bacterium]